VRPELAAIASAQRGVFLRYQALRCGYTKREIEALLRSGDWQRLRWGAYAERSMLEALDGAGRYGLLVRAAMLRVDSPAYASHNSASAVQSLPLWGTALSLVRITRPDTHSGRTQAGVKHHEASIAARDRVVVDGVPCTSLRRTALDVAREFGIAAGVVTADAAVRRGADLASMRALAESMRDWPRAPRMLEVVRLTDGGAQTPGESLARLFLVELGLPTPRTQVMFRSGLFVAIVDMYIEEYGWVLEFDGRLKYRRARDQAHDPVVDDADIVWAEKQREDQLRAIDGVRAVSRLVWADLFGVRRQEAAARLLATARRLGVPLDRRRAA
jgi:hypothetical protein